MIIVYTNNDINEAQKLKFAFHICHLFELGSSRESVVLDTEKKAFSLISYLLNLLKTKGF